MRFDALEQRRKPARLDEGVLIEEDQMASNCVCGALVARAAEPVVLRIQNDLRVCDLPEQRGRLVARAVVDDDELVIALSRCDQRRKRVSQKLADVVRDDDDRDLGNANVGKTKLFHARTVEAAR